LSYEVRGKYGLAMPKLREKIPLSGDFEKAVSTLIKSQIDKNIFK